MMRTLLFAIGSLALIAAPLAAGGQTAAPPAMGTLYQTIGNSVAMAAANAAYAQQQANVTYQAATSIAVGQMYTIDGSRASALAADPRARAVVEGQLPGLTTHPSFPTIGDMTLTQVAAHSGGLITADHLKAIQAGLATIR